MDAIAPTLPESDARLTERWQSLVDILYLSQVTFLYVFSAVCPAVGLLLGVLFLDGSLTARSKRIGKACLVLGMINTALITRLMTTMPVFGLAGARSGIGKD